MTDASLPVDPSAGDAATANPAQVAEKTDRGTAPTASLGAQPSTRLGRIALIMAIWVIVGSVLTSVLVGLFGTTVFVHGSVTDGGARGGFNAQPNQVISGGQILVGTVFGTWALVQGIVATAKNAGRRYGITAIVLAVVAPIVSIILWLSIALAAGHYVAV
ncbi:hypothetical protein V6S02_03480 [Microbacterium sp. CCNWLW134]|uniref:hypothetical protein n=1 Tax=Microbacterium sp. CCNWLW134 TaxID=3122064 RepID=UPI0030100781